MVAATYPRASGRRERLARCSEAVRECQDARRGDLHREGDRRSWGDCEADTKHQVTLDEVREALEWPAKVRVATEDHPEHGFRWIVIGQIGSSRELIAALLPTPDWEGDRADTWVLKTGRWV